MGKQTATAKSPADAAKPLAKPLEGEDKPEAALAVTPNAAPQAELPVLAKDEYERVVDPPIRVLIGPARALCEVVQLEKADLPAGQKDSVKAPGETRYLCRPVGKPTASPGTYLAGDLFVL